MTQEQAATGRPSGWWGGESPLLDDDEARRRLLDAASRCIVRRGSARIRMAEVAAEAGVARSTVYRYFPSRDDLIIGLFLVRIDAAFASVVAGLEHPDDAARSLPELVLGPLGYVEGNPLNEALFSTGSREMVVALELRSVPLLDAAYRQFGPLLERWQAEGQIYADVDLRDAMRWISLVSIMLLSPPWSEQPVGDKRAFLDRYFVRSLVAGSR